MTDYYALAYIMKTTDASTPTNKNLIGPPGSVSIADTNGGLTYNSNLKFNTGNNVLGVTGSVQTSRLIFDTSNVRIGRESGLTGQATTGIAIGAGAGQYNQQANAIAIGQWAGQTGQGAGAIAIGFGAGQTGQAANSIILNASSTALNGANSNAFYVKPIRSQVDVSNCASLFYQVSTGEIVSGPNCLPGGPTGAVQFNIGSGQGLTGSQNIIFNNETSVLGLTGTFKASQIVFDTSNVRIGNQSGLTSQATTGIAIGAGAGQYNQQANSIAIGQWAGQTGQGAGAIAIGFGAGQTGQAANSIVLNASSTALNGANSNAFYVKPIRTQVDVSNCASLFYQTSTGEIVSGPNCLPGGPTGAIQFNMGSGKGMTGTNNIVYNDDTQTLALQNGTLQISTINFNYGNISIAGNNPVMNQGINAIAIGALAGQTGQGTNAIAIGQYAGQTGQAANSIAINASGTPLIATTPSALYVKPIRAETANFNDYTQLSYNQATSEIVAFPITSINQTLTDNFSVAGGLGANPVAYTYDGKNWQSAKSVPSSGKLFADGSCNALGWNGSVWVAAGTGESALAYSSDGINWNTDVTGVTGGAVTSNVLDSGTWRQPVDISGNNGATSNDGFGTSVAISSLGNRFAMGAPTFGAAYIYDYAATTDTWALTNTATYIDQSFGSAMSMNADGTRVVVGAPSYTTNSSYGAFYDVFYNNGAWTTTLVAFTTYGGSLFGSSIAINPAGNRLLCGAPGYGSGIGLVFDYSYSSSWTAAGLIFNALPPRVISNFSYGIGNYNFGASIAYATNATTGLQRCLIGEPRNVASLAGHVYSFDLSGTSQLWGLYTRTTDSYTRPDQDISFNATMDGFGSAVAMDANGVTAAIGAPLYVNGSNSYAGAVYIYKHSGIGWGLYASLTSSTGGTANEYFGWSVALNAAGTRLVVGAKSNSDGSGKNYVFNYSLTTLQWVMETPALTSAVGSLMGTSVAMNANGNRFISGAPSPSFGHAYVFNRQRTGKALSWNGSVWNAGGNSTINQGPLAYSPDGINWQNNSLITSASNTLTQQFPSPFGALRYYAYATALNAAGTRMAVLSGGSGSTANSNVQCFIYDISSNGVWPQQWTFATATLGYVKYMQQMTNWNYSPALDNNVNMGCTPLAFNAAGDRLAIGVNFGLSGVGNTGFVNIYHYDYTTGAWPAAPTKQYVKSSGYIGSVSDFFGTSVAFNAMGTRLFISSVYNYSTQSSSTTGFINIYDVSGNVNWPPNMTGNAQLYDSNTSPQGGIGWSFYGAAIATNAAGNRLVVGAPSIILQNYYGSVYIYHLTASGWVNTPVRVYWADRLTGPPYTSNMLGTSVSMNAAGDRIAIGEFFQWGLNFPGRAYIIDYNSTTGQWPGVNTSYAADAATAWYIGANLTYQYFGTCIALNAAGDRLLISAPYNSVYDPNSYHFGVTYVLDYNYVTQSWPTTPVLFYKGMVISSITASPYFNIILGTKGQCLGNSLAINADGTVLAIGSPQAANYAGVLNLYNYKTKLALTGVNALASNGALTVAGGVGTNTIFATSTDGITFNNSVSDASGVLFQGMAAGGNAGATLISILENPRNLSYEYFGGEGMVRAEFNSYHSAVALNAAGTIMAISADRANSNAGFVYLYTAALYSPWTLVQQLTNPDNAANYFFGSSIALNARGNLLLVGARYYNNNNVGIAYIYGANSALNTWSLLQTIFNPNNTVDQFGHAVAINALGDVLSIGAQYYNASGVGRVYTYRANPALTNWSCDASLNNPAGTVDYVGNTVALNAAGNILAVGAYIFSNARGRVYIFVYRNGAWPAVPLTIANPTATNTEYFGNAVSLNAAGNILAVGAYNFSSAKGRAYVFVTANNWASAPSGVYAEGPTSPVATSQFGTTVVLNATGDILFVGAPEYSSSVGRVYVYQTTTTWTSFPAVASTIDVSYTGGNFGYDIAVNAAGTIIAAGAPNYNTNTGRVNTFTYNTPSVVLNQRTCKALATNGLLWVAGGPSTSNPLAWSNDGLTWYPSTNGTSTFPFTGGQCNAVVWNGSRWVAGGSGTNPLAFSYDGKTWWQSLNGPAIFPSGVANGLTWNSTFFLASGDGVAGNSYNTQAYSSDGMIWQVGTGGGTIFSGNKGLAVASRNSGSGAENTLEITSLETQTASLQSQITSLETQTASLQSQITDVSNQLIGIGQTWQNMKPVRAAGVSYPNDTGRTIVVYINMFASSAGSNGFIMTVGGLDFGFAYATYNTYIPYTVIVPPGVSYRIDSYGTYTLYAWNELR
jgi:hypothetical protein